MKIIHFFQDDFHLMVFFLITVVSCSEADNSTKAAGLAMSMSMTTTIFAIFTCFKG
jgi:hypothetical protein